MHCLCCFLFCYITIKIINNKPKQWSRLLSVSQETNNEKWPIILQTSAKNTHYSPCFLANLTSLSNIFWVAACADFSCNWCLSCTHTQSHTGATLSTAFARQNRKKTKTTTHFFPVHDTFRRHGSLRWFNHWRGDGSTAGHACTLSHVHQLIQLKFCWFFFFGFVNCLYFACVYICVCA